MKFNNGLQLAFEEENIVADLETELKDVYKSFDYQEFKPNSNL